MEYPRKTIQALAPDVRSMIRTGVALTTFAQAVEELVLNAVDAKATSIAIRIDLSCFKLQVVDNGLGITEDQFSLIGERYSTSKCHHVKDLDNLKYFGYRGEALASLRSTSSLFEIVSRPKGTCLTYSKCFQKGDCLGISQPSAHRPSHGTTITAYDLFYNLPVRRNAMNKALETERIRYKLAGIALMWPKISISLRDDSVGNVILQTQKCSGILATFSQLFTPARAKGLMEVSIDKDGFRIYGIVSKESYSRKDLQFVFVNKRLVLKSSIHKQVNKIFQRSLVLKRKGVNVEEPQKVRSHSQTGYPQGSPSKQIDQYAIYVLNVECPFKEYDITFDPSKTLVEFKSWPKLIHALQDMLYGSLRKENLLPPNMFNPAESDEKSHGFEKTRPDFLFKGPYLQRSDDESEHHQFSMTSMESLYSESVFRPGNVPFRRSESLNRDEGIHEIRNSSSIHQGSDTDATNRIPLCLGVHTGKQINIQKKVSFDTNEQLSQIMTNDVNYRISYSRPSRTISLNPKKSLEPCKMKENSEANTQARHQSISQGKGEISKALPAYGISTNGDSLDEEEPLSFHTTSVEVESEHPVQSYSNNNDRTVNQISLSKSTGYTSSLKSLRDINPYRVHNTSENTSKMMVHTLQNLRMRTNKHAENACEIMKTPERATRRKSMEAEQNSSHSKQKKLDKESASSSRMHAMNLTSNDESEMQHVVTEQDGISKINLGLHASSSASLSSTSISSLNQKGGRDSVRKKCDDSNKKRYEKRYDNTRYDGSCKEKCEKRTVNNKCESTKEHILKKPSQASKLARMMKGIPRSEEESKVSESSKHRKNLMSFTYAKGGKFATNKAIPSLEPMIFESSSVASEDNTRFDVSKEILQINPEIINQVDCEKSTNIISKENLEMNPNIVTHVDFEKSTKICVSKENLVISPNISSHMESKRLAHETDIPETKKKEPSFDKLPFSVYSTSRGTNINTPKMSLVLSVSMDTDQNPLTCLSKDSQPYPSVHVTETESLQLAHPTVTQSLSYASDQDGVNRKNATLSDVSSVNLQENFTKKMVERFSVNIDQEDCSSEASQGFDIRDEHHEPLSDTPLIRVEKSDDDREQIHSQGFTVTEMYRKFSLCLPDGDSNSPSHHVESTQFPTENEIDKDSKVDSLKVNYFEDNISPKNGNERNSQGRMTTIQVENKDDSIYCDSNKAVMSSCYLFKRSPKCLMEKNMENNLNEGSFVAGDRQISNGKCDTLMQMEISYSNDKFSACTDCCDQNGVCDEKGFISIGKETSILCDDENEKTKDIHIGDVSSESSSSLPCGQKEIGSEDSNNGISFDVTSGQEEVLAEHVNSDSSESITCGQRVEDPSEMMNNENSCNLQCAQEEDYAENKIDIANFSGVPCRQGGNTFKLVSPIESAETEDLTKSFDTERKGHKSLPFMCTSVTSMDSLPEAKLLADDMETEESPIIPLAESLQSDSIGQTDDIHQETGKLCKKNLLAGSSIFQTNKLISLSNFVKEATESAVESSLFTVKLSDKTFENMSSLDVKMDPIDTKLSGDEYDIREAAVLQEEQKAITDKKSMHNDCDGTRTGLDGGILSSKGKDTIIEVDNTHEIERRTRWQRVTQSVSGTTVYINNKSGHSISEEQWLKLSTQERDDLINGSSQDQLTNDSSFAHVSTTNESGDGENITVFSKWREAKRPIYDAAKGDDVGSVIEEWTDTVFLKYKLPSQMFFNLTDENNLKSKPQTLHHVEFTKDMLQNVQFLGQVDNKFLACTIENKNKTIKKATAPLLVFFDQHAAHERVRLEFLTSEVYESSKESETKRIKRGKIATPILLQLTQDDVRLMKAFTEEFDRIGLEFTEEKGCRDKINIHSVPLCMTESKRIKGALKEKTQELINEHIDLLKNTNGTCGKLPLAIHRVLCSQACRGAIKFGDSLSQRESEELLSDLSACNLPFQCAHGRPSIAPLINLLDLEVNPKDLVKRPKLQNITRLMKDKAGDRMQY